MDKKLHYTRYDAGLGFLNSIFLPALFAIVIYFLIGFLSAIFKWDTSTINESVWYKIPILLVSPISFFLSFVFVNKSSNVDYPKALGLYNKVKAQNIILCIAISVICIFGFMHFVDLFDATVASLGYKGNYDLPLPLDNVWWLLLNIVLVALLPALGEEIIFRGVIFNGLRDKGNKFAVFASAGLFMLMHGGIEQTVYPFIVGCILGMVMLKTNNIIYPMIIHFLNNAIVIIYNFVQLQTGFITTNFEFTAYNILFAILMLILSILMICIIVKLLMKGRKPVEREKNNENGVNKLMIVGVICGVIIWISNVIYGFGLNK